MTGHPPTPSGRHDLRPAALALGLSFLLGAIETVKAFIAGRDAPNAFGWAEALVTNLPWWVLWGLAAPLVFRLVRGFPLRRDRWRSAALVHASASGAISVLHLLLSAVIVWAAVSHTFLSLADQIRQLVTGYLVTDLVTYWAIAAAYGAWLTQARARRNDRERQKLETRNARLRARMSEARLAALRRELNPHFLFNTLNTISALAHRGDGGRAATAISRLSELLRRVLDDDLEEQVTLSEELDLLDLYLDIVRLRYGDRLSIRLDVEPGARNALVPGLILQPLAENAVQHGVEAARGAAELIVEARREDGVLRLAVRNRGSGAHPPHGPAGDRGVGLRNSRDRLRTLYGDEAALELQPDGEGGTRAVIRLPLEVEEEVRLRA